MGINLNNMGISKTLWDRCRAIELKRRTAQTDKNAVGTKKNLVFILTDRCNFSCRHCFRSPDRKDDLDLALAKRIIKESHRFGFRHVAITGGEPLLYPHLPELLEDICANHNTFSIVSNGSLFAEYLDTLKTYRRNMSYIAFSLESSDPCQHDHVRQKGSYEKLIEAFSHCRRAKIPFRIVTAVSTANFEQLFDITLLSRKQGAQRLILSTILPCPHAQDNQYVLDPQQRNELFLTSAALSKIAGIPIGIAADIRTSDPIRMCVPLNFNEITVNAKGEMVQCCELANFDNEDIRRFSFVCSLKDRTFAQALEICSHRLSDLEQSRIKDLQNAKDPNHVDANSCFYCVHKLGAKG